MLRRWSGDGCLTSRRSGLGRQILLSAIIVEFALKLFQVIFDSRCMRLLLFGTDPSASPNRRIAAATLRSLILARPMQKIKQSDSGDIVA